MKLLFTQTSLFCFLVSFSFAQKITVNPSDFKQKFMGTGASCGLYLGHYISMSEEDQLKTSRMLYEDLGMTYIKTYPKGRYPNEAPKGVEEFNNTSKAISNAKKIRPDLKVILCVNNLPDALEVKDAKGDGIKGEFDRSIEGIYDKIADYYFQVCKGYYDRGHVVDILELSNEPGFGKEKDRVTDVFDKVADRFRAMMSNPEINTQNIPMPKIAGLGTWSATGPKQFIDYWKKNRPNAWKNVDIVTTHAYQNGTEANMRETYDRCDGRLFMQSEQTGRIQTDEKPGVDEIADQFKTKDFNPEFVANTSIARHMINFFNANGNAFFAFLTNNPKHNNAALVTTRWNEAPKPSPIYHGFKHLAGTHPINSHRVTCSLKDADRIRAVAFRKKGKKYAYVHFINLYNTYEEVTIDFKGAGIQSAHVWRTDEFVKFGNVGNHTFPKVLKELKVVATPYSINTVKVELSEEVATEVMETQEITFGKIKFQNETNPDFAVTATSTSGLPVELQVLSGPAVIEKGVLKLTGVGIVRVLASQAGNDEYAVAIPVLRTFPVYPQGENVALNKPALASSANGIYTAEKAVDGIKDDPENRWSNVKKKETTAKDPHWLEIDLLEKKTIHAISLTNKVDTRKVPIYGFEFQIWNGETWETVLEEDSNYEGKYLKGFPEVTTTKVRLLMEKAPKKYMAELFEIEVFAPAETKTLGAELEPELFATDKISLYPNPAQEMLYIEGVKAKDQIRISTLAGKTIVAKEYEQGLQISDLQDGIYLISVNGKAYSKFIKKQ